MISLQYNETVAVKRLTDGSGVVREFGTHLASVSCVIQPLDSEISGDIDGGFGKEWLMFCAEADIQEGDRVIRGTGETAKEYRVTGVESFDFIGNSHMEIRIRIFES